MSSISTATSADPKARSSLQVRKAAPDIAQRRSLLGHHVMSILEAAAASHVHASPVRCADGCINEVNVYGGGSLIGTIYRPASGALAIWLDDRDQRHAANARVAVAALLRGRGLN